MLCLTVPDRQGKYHLQSLLNEINEQDTLCFDCKHKYMMKSGAPPDKVRSPVPCVTNRIPWFHRQN